MTLEPAEKNMFCGKSYCTNCYSILRRDADAYKALMDSICKMFDIQQPTGLILKQVKEYKNELKYNYAAMTYTLWYITEVLRSHMDSKFGIALVKYNYEEAKNYFEQQEKIASSIENVEVKTKIVKKSKHNQANNFNSLVDITKIIEGGDSNKL